MKYFNMIKRNWWFFTDWANHELPYTNKPILSVKNKNDMLLMGFYNQRNDNKIESVSNENIDK